jgi:TPR repeat protein
VLDVPFLPVGNRAPIDPCDELAAHRYDPQRVVLGRELDQIDGPGAERACTAALLTYPDEARFIYQLGMTYERLADRPRAFALMRDAAQRSYIAAYSMVGWHYLNAVGTPRDTALAAQWARRGVDADDTVAINLLGLMYRQGAGVERDDREAARLTTIAANRGYWLAQNNLARERRRARPGPRSAVCRQYCSRDEPGDGRPKASDTGIVSAECPVKLRRGLAGESWGFGQPKPRVRFRQ